MAFQEVAVSSPESAAAAIRSFLVSLGWEGGGTSVRRPAEAGQVGESVALEILGGTTVGTATDPLTANGSTTLKHIRVTSLSNPADRMSCYMPMMRSGERQALIPNPTKLYCFGEGLPKPWAAFVLEFGFNQYRPIYIGGIDKIGSHGPGDLISTVVGIYYDHDNSGWPKNERAWQGMFSGGLGTDIPLGNGDGAGATTREGGGLFLGSPPVLNRLNFQSGSPIPTVAGSTASNLPVIFGGPRDGVDDTLISHGQSPFNGENILSVISLMTIRGGSGARRVLPLGQVRGVRGVNMKNLEPGARIVVGNKAYRVFPQISKNPDPNTPLGARGPTQTGTNYSGYCARESSGMWGFAYLEGDAV